VPLFQVHKKGVAVITDSQMMAMIAHDKVIHEKAKLIVVPDDATIDERLRAEAEAREENDGL